MKRIALVLMLFIGATSAASAESGIDVIGTQKLCDQYVPAEIDRITCREDVQNLADAAAQFQSAKGTERALPEYKNYLEMLGGFMEKYPAEIVMGISWLRSLSI